MNFFPNSFCNLINLKLFNNSGIYHNYKYKTLSYVKSKKVLVQVRYWKNIYLLKLLNLFDKDIHLLKVGNNNY